MKKLLSDKDGDTDVISRKMKIRCIIVIISLVLGGIGGWKLNDFINKEEISTDYLTAKLEDASELTTQKITYTSRVPIEKGSIPFINKRGFVMKYNATLRAGVDMKEVNVKQRGNKIIVKIPHAEVLDEPNVDSDSLKFYDEKKALFSWKKHEDVAQAISKAKKDVKNNPSVDMTSLLQRADENTEKLIHTILDDSVKGCKVVVRFVNS